ncbi:RHS repeat-associated core domain-containing protein, partial [Streptomyces sp. NPDC057910]|uniref:RHS repeat-associated core domain-containing protein n=1 Tax=Streptomyces sp. NPDC057910 TaxID=3346278 RepID=UPI0036E3245C
PLTATSPDGTVTAYTYWADGTRRDTVTTGKDGAATRTGFYYTPDGTITNDTHTTGEGSGDGGSDGGGPVTASYLSAATREARTLTGSTEGGATAGAYLLHDRHGSTTALATADEAAAVTAAWNYNDYGQHTTTTGTPLTTNAGTGAGGDGSGAAAAAGTAAAVNPFTYSGEHTDTRLGTQYLKSRVYDPSQGRFTTRDTAPLHNRYQYADTNPITNTDPTGQTADRDKIVSGVMIGVTLLAAIVTVAVTALTAGWGTALGIALAGAVLDTASAAVETAALATGNNQWDSPLNITAYTLGGLGLFIGAASPAIGRGIGIAAKSKEEKIELIKWKERVRGGDKLPESRDGGTDYSRRVTEVHRKVRADRDVHGNTGVCGYVTCMLVENLNGLGFGFKNQTPLNTVTGGYRSPLHIEARYKVSGRVFDRSEFSEWATERNIESGNRLYVVHAYSSNEGHAGYMYDAGKRYAGDIEWNAEPSDARSTKSVHMQWIDRFDRFYVDEIRGVLHKDLKATAAT